MSRSAIQRSPTASSTALCITLIALKCSARPCASLATSRSANNALRISTVLRREKDYVLDYVPFPTPLSPLVAFFLRFAPDYPSHNPNT